MPRDFKRIGLWGRLQDPKVAEPAAQIKSHLAASGYEIFVTTERAGALDGVTPVEPEAFATSVDLVVAVGGDGNLLRAARRVAGQDVPLIGVNRGRLGFLTDITPEQMIQALDRILAGDFLAEKRMLLNCKRAHPAGFSTTKPASPAATLIRMAVTG